MNEISSHITFILDIGFWLLVLLIVTVFIAHLPDDDDGL